MRDQLYILFLVVGIGLLVFASCGQSAPRNQLLANPAGASPELRDACRLTEQKCTRCHPIGKLFAIDVQGRQEWAPIVDRMRRISASSITIEDAEVVLNCLEQRVR
jgi:cytochrome c5